MFVISGELIEISYEICNHAHNAIEPLVENYIQLFIY